MSKKMLAVVATALSFGLVSCGQTQTPAAPEATGAVVATGMEAPVPTVAPEATGAAMATGTEAVATGTVVSTGTEVATGAAMATGTVAATGAAQ